MSLTMMRGYQREGICLMDSRIHCVGRNGDSKGEDVGMMVLLGCERECA